MTLLNEAPMSESDVLKAIQEANGAQQAPDNTRDALVKKIREDWLKFNSPTSDKTPQTISQTPPPATQVQVQDAGESKPAAPSAVSPAPAQSDDTLKQLALDYEAKLASQAKEHRSELRRVNASLKAEQAKGYLASLPEDQRSLYVSAADIAISNAEMLTQKYELPDEVAEDLIKMPIKEQKAYAEKMARLIRKPETAADEMIRAAKAKAQPAPSAPKADAASERIVTTAGDRVVGKQPLTLDELRAQARSETNPAKLAILDKQIRAAIGMKYGPLSVEKPVTQPFLVG